MNKILIAVTCLLMMTACVNKHEGEQKTGILSNFIKITDNEDKGIKAVLAFYGGYCQYSIGAITSTDEGNKKYFVLELSKSESLEKLKQAFEMPASNIAYLFYKKLTDERKNYDEIRVVQVLSDGEKLTYKFPTKQLEIVENKILIAGKIVELIKNKNFEGIIPMISSEYLDKDAQIKLVNNLKSIEPQFGNVTGGFRPYGFSIEKTKNNSEILHISGVIIREKQSNEFSIDLDLNGSDEKIYSLNYKL
jgi:hypothetical protein